MSRQATLIAGEKRAEWTNESPAWAIDISLLLYGVSIPPEGSRGRYSEPGIPEHVLTSATTPCTYSIHTRR